MRVLLESNVEQLGNSSKIFVNGNWIGTIDSPIEVVNVLKLYRRNGIIPIYTSVSFDYKRNEVYIYTDAGRICRPIFYMDTDSEKFSFESEKIKKRLESLEE
jgi:DNA-directed RNA polymerase II subunit RPB2